MDARATAHAPVRGDADSGPDAGPCDPSARRMRRWAGRVGAAVCLIGLLVTAGWILGAPALTSTPGPLAMKLTTALCVVGVGSAITFMAHAELTGSTRTRRVAVLLAVAVALVGLAVLVEDLLGLTSPVDNPFGLDPGDPHTLVPGRMAEMTALSLVGLGVALVLTARHRDKTAHAALLAVLTLASPGVVGYEYGVHTPYGLGPFNTMEVPTAIAIVLAGSAALFLRPGAGILSLLVGDSAGGVLTRLLLPWVTLGPNVIGAVVVIAVHHRGYAGPFALAIVVTVLTIAGTVLVWFQGENLREVDLRRGGAENALAIAEQALADRDRVQQELATSVRRTHRILATAADAYIAIDTQGRVTDWNDAAAAIFGWSREEVLGEPLETLIIPADHVAAHQAGIRRYLVSGEAPILGRQLELEALNRAGTVIPVELTVWADQDGTVEGFHAFVRDITARKGAEEDLRRLNADLSEFAAIAAHDLRSPLTTVQMQADLVLAELEAADWGPDETRHWIERIGRTADRGVLLIDDLLSYVSIGREAHASRPVDLDALTRDVADTQLSAAGRLATCSVGRLPVVAGDEALLRQLVANLVGNAIKYVPADRMPEVVVDALVEVEDRCVLRVSDNGAGFAEDERERVFEMFQRGSGSSGVPGTGIGLAICRRVAERHGGRIWIDLAPAGGSRICVELPLWSNALPDAGPGSREPAARD